MVNKRYEDNKMKHFRLSAVLCEATSLALGSANVLVENDDIWDSLEQRYYIGNNAAAPSAALKVSDNSESILNGSQLDNSKWVQSFCVSFDVATPNGLSEFVSAIRSNEKIADMLEAEKLFLSTLTGTGDPVPSTAMMSRRGSSYDVCAVRETDKGQSFALNLTTAIKKQITNSGLDIENTDVKFIRFDGYMTEIFFTDGNIEAILPITVLTSDLENNKLYKMSEIAENLTANKDTIAPVLPQAKEKDGKLIPYTD